MQTEKQCPYCKKMFFYEDGRDDEKDRPTITGYCPQCVDPCSVPGETYLKKTILSAIKRYLQDESIDVTHLDEGTIEAMLKEFPRVHQMYYSNSTYRTFTIYTGTIFEGKYGKFEMLHSEVIDITDNWDATVRYIRCCRCNETSRISKTTALDYFLGLHEKQCKHCDAAKWLHNPNTNIKRGGSQKSEFSARALAKALNVSRNDYMRHPDIEYTPALPEGHIAKVYGHYEYKIIKAWWDESPKSYSPKYIVECQKCKQKFEIVQKHLYNTTHYCVDTPVNEPILESAK